MRTSNASGGGRFHKMDLATLRLRAEQMQAEIERLRAELLRAEQRCEYWYEETLRLLQKPAEGGGGSGTPQSNHEASSRATTGSAP